LKNPPTITKENPMTTLSQTLPSRYTLYHTLADRGFAPARIVTIIEALLGPAPEEEDDGRWDEYAAWSEMQDCLEAAHPPVRECDIQAAGLAI
jgi:hypothetical protein